MKKGSLFKRKRNSRSGGRRWKRRRGKMKRAVVVALISGICSLLAFSVIFITMDKPTIPTPIVQSQDAFTAAYLYLGKLDKKQDRLSVDGMNIDGDRILAYFMAKYGTNYQFQPQEVRQIYKNVYRKGKGYIDKKAKQEGLKRDYEKLRKGEMFELFQTFGSPFPEDAWTKHISSKWGVRIRPNFGTAAVHRGLDISMPQGKPIHSIMDGTVISVNSCGSSLGNHIEIRSAEKSKDIRSLYAHMSKIKVKKGQKIKRGKVIGKVGSTGNSTGPHLHLELYIGTYKYENTEQLLYPRLYVKE